MSTPKDLGVVDEQIFSTVVGSDKAKALIAVEPFDGSLCYISYLFHSADGENIRSQPTRRRVPIASQRFLTGLGRPTNAPPVLPLRD